MIDVNSQFFALLTAVGEAKQVKADAGLITWKLTHMAVGDANDTNPIPDRLQKTLINERRRAPLNSLGPDPANPGILIAEQIIPADEGGFWIRELGLFDSDGDLVAVANCAPSYKSLLSQGSGKTQVLRMNFVVKSSSNVVLLIDPSVVTATRKYVDDSVANAVNRLDTKQSVLVATTAPMVLAGVQEIDGLAVPVGSRVLVKDQAQAKDNGLYLVSTDSWKRTVDADGDEKVTPGLLVTVERGSKYADTLWMLTTDAPIVLGTTALTFRDITDGFAPLDSPVFTGDPKAPTPTQFDRDESIATTKFVGDSLGSHRGLEVVTTAAKALTKAHIGYLMVLSGNGSIIATLPPANSVPAGASISFFVDHGLLTPDTIKATGTDVINAGFGAFLSVLTLNNGDFLTLVSSGGGTWCATSRSVRLDQSSEFRQSKATNGYRYLPGGMLECWGLSAATTDTVNITFAEQFSKPPFIVPYDSSNVGATLMTMWQVTAVSTTGFIAQNMCSFIRGNTAVNTPTSSQCNWRAWGWVNK
ncbi:phage tail protein [Pseudomonas sp. bs2935]|uniref:phage tail protein n=1 Tax=Pseudomonas sp. bs2935 TaxID=1761895 RepID=UPI00087D70AB|nr:phage tail protein [Pseudomonas sp. bs2935]SDT01019.1 Phage tail-collar fibre protein [Pseudomonas sp. bs2935]